MTAVLCALGMFVLLADPARTVPRLDAQELLRWAKAGDLRQLETVKEEIDQANNSELSQAYALALFIASPSTFTDRFISAFPTDYQGVMIGYYQNLEVPALTPRFLFSFESLGGLATSGNEKAIDKLLFATAHSEGVVTEVLCDYVVGGIKSNILPRLIKTLDAMPTSERRKVYVCLRLSRSDPDLGHALQAFLNGDQSPGGANIAAEMLSELRRGD